MENEIQKLREEAVQHVFENEDTEPQHRICWNCDPIKEYLKKSEHVIICPHCDHVFYKGVDITIKEDEK